MALTGMASRFSVLPDDDTTDWVMPKSKKGGNKSQQANVAGKGDNSTKKPRQNSAKNDAKELQAAAFGVPVKKKNNKKKPNGPAVAPTASATSPGTTSVQFEKWQEKDKEFTSEKFAEDLEEALLLSKLDFEEKRDFYSTPDIEGKSRKQQQPHPVSKKPLTVSLDEFNALDSKQLLKMKQGEKATSPTNNGTSHHSAVNDVNFFEQLNEETRKAITRDQLLDSFRQNQHAFASDHVLMEHFRSNMEEKNLEISKLKSENSSVKEELANVKKRYKKLREILDQSEVREKAEIIVDNEKLKAIRDDLTSEVSRLNVELEQMKTRVAEMSREARKNSGKRPSEHKPM